MGDGPSPSERFGRIDADGNVFVTLPDGNEQFVGRWAAGDPADGLRMFARRYDDLVVDVDLAGRRMAEDTSRRTRLSAQSSGCGRPCRPRVGDLAGLADRLRQPGRS